MTSEEHKLLIENNIALKQILAYIASRDGTYIKYSPTCYKIGNKFTIWIILTSCLILPAWLEISVVQFLPFLSVVFLSIVGLAPQYLSSDRVLHISSALATATISLIWNFVSDICNTYYVNICCVDTYNFKSKEFNLLD